MRRSSFRLLSFPQKVLALTRLPAGTGPIERSANDGLPFVSADAATRAARTVISAEALYAGVSFQCSVFKTSNGTYAVFSRDFPWTVGIGCTAKAAIRDLRVIAENVLDDAMQTANTYRVPTNCDVPIVAADVLDKECAAMVQSVYCATFVVFSKSGNA